MKNIKLLAELFEQARAELKNEPASDIRLLVESGKASPLAARRSFRPRRITRLFNPLKILIMTTTIVIITSLLLILNPGGRRDAYLRPPQPGGKQQIEKPEMSINEPFTSSAQNAIIDSGVIDIDSIRSKRSILKSSVTIPNISQSSKRISFLDNHQAVVSVDSGLIASTKERFKLAGSGNIILLNSEILNCLGINCSDNRIEATIKTYKSWNKVEVYMEKSMNVACNPLAIIPDGERADTVLPTTESIILYAISNFKGTFIVDFLTQEYRSLNRTNFSFWQHLDFCIPVLVDLTEKGQIKNEVFFWIYPNERFFSCLPPEIAEPMRKEFVYQQKRLDHGFVPQMGGSIGNGGGQPAKETYDMGVPVKAPTQVLKKDSLNVNSEPVPCVYFTNLCESLPGLDYVNLYPNPATDKLTVDMVLQQAKKIRFRVVDFGGRVLSDGETPENYPQAGQSKHQMDVSKLQNGMYLLVMTDEEGARVTRRFVKN